MNRLPSCLLLLLPLTGACSDSASVFVLDAAVGPIVMQQCSRPTPKVERFWNPPSAAIDLAEANLTRIPYTQYQMMQPLKYKRQYIGVVVNGVELLYVNAVPLTADAIDMSKPARACDGGPAFWGALFNLQTLEFTDIQTNGVI